VNDDCMNRTAPCLHNININEMFVDANFMAFWRILFVWLLCTLQT